MHKTIKKVGDDIEAMKFNTAIAAMMTLLNEISETRSITRGEYKTLIVLLNPFAPHITEEIWQNLGCDGRVYEQAWPEFDEAKCKNDTIEVIVQVNGKLKDKLLIAPGSSKEEMLSAAKALEKIVAATEGKMIVKEIVVPDKLVNIVVK